MSLELQLKHLELQPKKVCHQHCRSAQFLCYRLNCNKHAYLCQQCLKEGIHGHNDKISGWPEAFRELCLDIQKGANRQSDDWVSSFISKLQSSVLQAIKQLKQSLIAESRSDGQPSSSYRLYGNPNILAKKIQSEVDMSWFLQMKKTLSQEKSQIGLTIPQLRLKFHIDIFKQRLDTVLSDNIPLFRPSAPLTARTEPRQENAAVRIARTKVYGLPALPNHIYNFKDSMLVCCQRSSYLFNLSLKTAMPLQPQFKLCCPVANKPGDFVASSQPNLFYFCDGKIQQQVQIRQNLSAIGAIQTDSVYAFLGFQDGTIEFYRLLTGQLISRQNKHLTSIISIRPLYEDVIVVASRDSRLSIHQVSYKPQLKLDFLSYASMTIENLTGFQVFKNDFILYNDTGNIKIYDSNNGLMLYESRVKQPPIVDMIILQTTKGYNLLTVAKNDKDVKVWIFDREKQEMRQDRLPCNIKNNNISHNSIFFWGNSLWLLKEMAPEVHLFDLQMQ